MRRSRSLRGGAGRTARRSGRHRRLPRARTRRGVHGPNDHRCRRGCCAGRTRRGCREVVLGRAIAAPPLRPARPAGRTECEAGGQHRAVERLRPLACLGAGDPRSQDRGLSFFILVALFILALAIRPIVESFAISVVIASRPAFDVGDEIGVGGVVGEVLEITERSVVVRLRDGARVHIPNGEVMSERVTDFSPMPNVDQPSRSGQAGP